MVVMTAMATAVYYVRPMTAVFRKDGETGIITVDGKLGHGPNLEEFHAQWTDAVESGCHRIIVNLTNVPSIDSMGMGSLVRCQAAAAAQGGGLRIVGARPSIMHAMALTQLDQIFQFYPDESSAAVSFTKGK